MALVSKSIGGGKRGNSLNGESARYATCVFVGSCDLFSIGRSFVVDHDTSTKRVAVLRFQRHFPWTCRFGGTCRSRAEQGLIHVPQRSDRSPASFNSRLTTSARSSSESGNLANINKAAAKFVSPGPFSLALRISGATSGATGFCCRRNSLPVLTCKLQPSASDAGGLELEVRTGNELQRYDTTVCTRVCTNSVDSEILSDMAKDSESTRPVNFAAALVMIAGLPLSDADKAEAVKRLLAQGQR
jgi:hypothetical protein